MTLPLNSIDLGVEITNSQIPSQPHIACHSEIWTIDIAAFIVINQRKWSRQRPRQRPRRSEPRHTRLEPLTLLPSQKLTRHPQGPSQARRGREDSETNRRKGDQESSPWYEPHLPSHYPKSRLTTQQHEANLPMPKDPGNEDSDGEMPPAFRGEIPPGLRKRDAQSLRRRPRRPGT